MAAQITVGAAVGANRSYDAAIIGAGPAGSLAASRLARDGHRAVVIERAHFPRHAIGESLLPHCTDSLQEAGLWGAVEAAGYTRKHGARFLRGEVSERFCFAQGLGGDTPEALQVPRDEFDQLLASEAARLGAEIRFGHAVTDARFDGDGAHLTTRCLDDGVEHTIRARFVLDCSGPAAVLPGLLGLGQPPSSPARIASFTQVDVDTRPTGECEGDIWVCCHPEGGWTWIIPFASGRTSVGFVCDADHWDALPGDEPGRLAQRIASDPNARRRLGALHPLWEPRTIRNFATTVSRMHGQGWVLVGHSGGFIDPVLSSGVTLSLDAAHRASALVHRALSGEAVDWSGDYEAPMRRSTEVFRAFVDSWYDGSLPAIFFSEGKPERVKRRITSILAGYTMREDNPLARDPAAALDTLHRFSARGPDTRRALPEAEGD